MKKYNTLAGILVGLMFLSAAGSAVAASPTPTKAKKELALQLKVVQKAKASEHALKSKLDTEKAEEKKLKEVISTSNDTVAVAHAKDLLNVLVLRVEGLLIRDKEAKKILLESEKKLVLDVKILKKVDPTF